MASAHTLNFFQRKWRRIIQTYGSEGMKQRQWDREFQEGVWDYLADTAGDPIYTVLEKHARNGSILDLGCGLGNTANELPEGSYLNYTGVDISNQAVQMAARRTQKNGRAHNTHFLQSDIETYVPDKKHHVILFRDSIYYLPHSSVPRVLHRYADYLHEGGVFILRLAAGVKCAPEVEGIIASNFPVLERHIIDAPPAVILVFR